MTETDETHKGKIPKITAPVTLLIALLSGIAIVLPSMYNWEEIILVTTYFFGLGAFFMYIMLVRSEKKTPKQFYSDIFYAFFGLACICFAVIFFVFGVKGYNLLSSNWFGNLVPISCLITVVILAGLVYISWKKVQW